MTWYFVGKNSSALFWHTNTFLSKSVAVFLLELEVVVLLFSFDSGASWIVGSWDVPFGVSSNEKENKRGQQCSQLPLQENTWVWNHKSFYFTEGLYDIYMRYLQKFYRFYTILISEVIKLAVIDVTLKNLYLLAVVAFHRLSNNMRKNSSLGYNKCKVTATNDKKRDTYCCYRWRNRKFHAQILEINWYRFYIALACFPVPVIEQCLYTENCRKGKFRTEF